MTETKGADDSGVDVFMEKAPSYKTIHCDGFVLTPNGRAHAVISFYNERLAIPKHIRISPTSDNNYTENFIDGKKGVFRQIEASVFIDLATVDELIAELTNVRKFIKQHSEPSKEDRADV